MASSATSRGGTRLPHHTARRAGLDPPTRLTEGKPSRKNRPPFHGRKRTTATTLPPPLSSRPFLVTTTTTIGTLPSFASATVTVPPPPPTPINRHLEERGYQNLRIWIALSGPSTNALLITYCWIYHLLYIFIGDYPIKIGYK